MITTESNNIDLLRFFKSEQNERMLRASNTMVHKYRRLIMKLLQKHKGEAVNPFIFTSYKLEDGNVIYSYPYGIKSSKHGFAATNICEFTVLQDIRTLKPVLITASKPSVIIFSTHAVRRFRERNTLPESSTFLDVCKRMIVSGCAQPRLIVNCNTVYGATENPVVSFITLGGIYLGFFEFKTHVLHAETYITEEDLKNDQDFLSAVSQPFHKDWLTAQIAEIKGDNSLLQKNLSQQPRRIRIDKGKIHLLSQQEIEDEDAENARLREETPDYLKRQQETNKERYESKMARKGYK